jgi:Putative auto-transporter adhesin, head GIN domain
MRSPASANGVRWVALLAAAAIAIGTVAGCNPFGRSGQGPVKDETRTTAAFSLIDVSNGIALTAEIGPTQSVVVHAQENLLPIIATDVQGGTLKIHSTQGYSTTESVSVTVVTPALTGITMSGGSQGTANGIAADRFTIDLSGGAGLTASGSTSTLALQASGGARAGLGELVAKSVTLDVSGGSSAIVQGTDTIVGSASGGARVCSGRIDVQTTGGAEVTHG